ncbi:MAG TPA: hypothetical protein VMS17_32700 [Gemmataceae bacterium]|nr:hypothetical protein [Gemmataceae bacterium]
MRADLAAWKKALDEDAVGTRNTVQWIGTWRGDPDLSGLFEPSELEWPPPDKR